MKLVQLPDGEYAQVDDDATTADVQRFINDHAKQLRARAAQRAAANAPTPDQQEVQRRVGAQRQVEAAGISSNPFLSTASGGRGFNQGVLLNFGDEFSGGVSALTSGVVNAIRKGDISEIPHEYRLQRDTERELNKQAGEDHPVANTAAEVLGSLASPVGLFTGGAGAGTEASSAIARALQGPVGQAVKWGAVQGGVNSIGASDADNVSGLLDAGVQGAAAGGLTGGALAGVLRAGSGVAHILQDRLPQNAERVAYDRVNNALENANMSPEYAALQVDRAQRAGNNDFRVMDLTPGTRAEAAAISKKPNVPVSNALTNMGEQRISDRGQAFSNKITALADVPTDANATIRDIIATRKAHAGENYDKVLDAPLNWTDNLQDWYANSVPYARDAMKQAASLMVNERLDPVSQGWRFDGKTGDVVQAMVPNLRTLDYVKRGFDDNIGAAMRAGDKNKARILSGELGSLKAAMAEANPKYADILATQRDLYQQQEAVQLGQTVLQSMRKEPQETLRNLHGLAQQDAANAAKGQPTNYANNARTGIIHAILDLPNQKANPVTFMNTVLRMPEQRKVLSFAFGSDAKVSQFEQWMQREGKSYLTDRLISQGRVSPTALYAEASNGLGEATGAADLGKSVLRGYAFGGKPGAVSGAIRGLDNMKHGVTNNVMDQIGRILMSNGQGMPAGIAASQKVSKERAKNAIAQAILAARGGQQPITDYTGG